MMAAALCGILAALIASAEPEPRSLRDHPIASGAAPAYLDGAWTVQPSGPGGAALPKASIAATVPGDILTDLQRAGAQPDPYFNSTWRESDFIASWNEGTWTYTKTFPTPASGAAHLLVFEGIRMGAMIALNGQPLGNATDQFLRYIFPVSALLKAGGADNNLTVTFGDELRIDCGGRYTYSSEIDWAPTMLTHDSHAAPVGNVANRSTFGFGIWKSVYLLPVPAATAPVITQLVSHTFYSGGHPTSMLTDSDHMGFRLEATVELFTLAAGGSGTLSILGDWPGATQESTTLSALPAGTSNATVTLEAAQTVGAKLWQPHGHGAQNRYTLTATFTPSG